MNVQLTARIKGKITSLSFLYVPFPLLDRSAMQAVIANGGRATLNQVPTENTCMHLYLKNSQWEPPLRRCDWPKTPKCFKAPKTEPRGVPKSSFISGYLN